MNISFQNFHRRWLLHIFLLAAVLPVKAIQIGGVEYTQHSLSNITGDSQYTIGEDGKNQYWEISNCNLQISEGRGAAITIRGNVIIGVNGTLNVKGGDARGYIGAGAGIHVPNGANLTIMPAVGQSSCTVTAYGGNAGQPNVMLDTESGPAKYNNGAGGAGAGIGGNGGNGGTARNIFDSNGNFSNGNNGQPSEKCGNITIEKGVTLTAIGGRGTGVEQTDAYGKKIYNFDVVSAANGQKNHGYVAAGVKFYSEYSIGLSTELAYTDGDTWSTTDNSARGSVGGQGGGGGGYPAAGIGGGGSGGGAGGFGTHGSEQTKKATAVGHGGNAGGGGSGYGLPGQFGIGGGYAKFGFGMERPIIISVASENKEAGEYVVKDGLYSGRNGYWGQKNFSGTGHAAGQSGSTTLNGVRPGTFLDGSKATETVNGSHVTTQGVPGGGVLFDSQCGEIIIRGTVTSLGNGGHQPKQFETIGSITYNNPNKPYYINDIGTALNGDHNPFNVIVDGGRLTTYRQEGLTMTDGSGYPAKEYTVTVTRWARFGNGLLYSPPPEKKTVRVSGIQHWKEAFGGTHLYFSYIGLEQGKERFVHANPLPEKRHGAHYDGISVAERYYSDKNLPSADWSYTTMPSWSTVTNDTQTDYAFNGRVDTSTSEDRLGLMTFQTSVRGGTLNFGGVEIGPTNGMEPKSILLTTNKFQTRFHRTASDGGCDLTWMKWTPLNFIFSGKGGRDYELQNISPESLPNYKNNNTDGTFILGYFTEAATDKDDYQQINGQSYNSIQDFVAAGCNNIQVVTWDPARELVSPESRGKMSTSINFPTSWDEDPERWTTGAWEKGSDDNYHIMARLDSHNNGISLHVNAKQQMLIACSFKGKIWVTVGGSSRTYESGGWATIQFPVEAGDQVININANYLGGAYVYDFHEVQTLPQDENGVYIIRTSEDLDAAAELISRSSGLPLHFRVIGTVETSADFESIGKFPNYFAGSMTGGHIKLTNGKTLIDTAWDAAFSDITVSGDINIDDYSYYMSTFFAKSVTNCTFTNCKVQGTLNSIIGLDFAGFTSSGNGVVFDHCVSDVTVTGHTEIYRDVPHVNIMAGFAICHDLTMRDCAFTGSLTSTDDNGVVYYGVPFSKKLISTDEPAQIENCISTFDPQVDEIEYNSLTNCYILADTEEARGNYITKTAEQFASGEVGYLLAKGGQSHWHTPIGSAYPVYDVDNLYTHAHIIAGENIHLSNDSQSKAAHLYTLEGERFNATHSDGKDCLIYHNDELVAANGNYDGTAPAGESLVVMKDHAKAGDEFEYGGIKYVIITEPDGDAPGTVMTKPGAYENYGNSGLSGDIAIPQTVYSEGRLYTVTEIGEYSLEGGAVSSISLPETLTAIGESGLRGLSGITSVVIPANVTSLGYELFKNCNNLKSVTFAEGSKITELPQSAFEETGISTLDIPETVTSIANFAFFRCPNLESIELPEGLTSLGWMAFGESSNLKTVVYLSDKPVSGSAYDFADYTTPTLYALKSAKDEYEAVDPWKQFQNIVWCGISLNEYELSMRHKDTAQLTADVVVPPGKTASDIVWSSSDPSVASVDENGKVYAESSGNATITATSGDYKADCEVTVTYSTSGIDEIFADESDRADIYTLEGICIKRDANIEDVKVLSPGFYIIGGRKVFISR